MAFPIISILAGTSTQLEQLGTKAKFWYELGDEQRILFKEGRPGENPHHAMASQPMPHCQPHQAKSAPQVSSTAG